MRELARKLDGEAMSSPIPDDPDSLLRREATADALTASGFPTAAKTLATKASRGGGPPYRKYGPWPLYRWGDALAWAQARLGKPRFNTSERGKSEPSGAQAPGRGGQATP